MARQFECFPDHLKKTLPGDVIYELCKTKVERVYDFNKGGTTERFIAPSQEYVFNTFGYHCPDTDKFYDIRYIISERVVTKDNGDSMVVPVFGNIVFKKNEHGRKVLRKGNYQDELLYTILELHPMNVARGGKLFRKIDMTQEVTKESIKIDYEMKALNLAYQMTDKDIDFTLKGLLVEFPIPVSEVDIKEKRVRLMQIAKSDPETFLKNINSINFEYLSVVKDAEDLKIIQFDEDAQTWRYVKNGNSALHSNKIPGMNKYDSMVEWFKSGKQGELGFERLKTDLDGPTITSDVKIDTKAETKKPSRQVEIE